MLTYFYALVGLFPVELLDGLDVVGGELDVGGEAAVEGRHQGRPLVAVRQTQRVAELVRSGLQQVRACRGRKRVGFISSSLCKEQWG